MIILGLFMGSFIKRAIWDFLVVDKDNWKQIENGGFY